MQRLLSNPVLSFPDRPTMPERARAAPSLGGKAGALSVVVVEDDDAVRAACATMAGSLGCHVRVAESIPRARAVLAEAPVDVVFLDMRLPGGTGSVLLEEIRTAHPRAFVVVMTAYATVNSAVELMRNGAGDFLQKPFALQQVTTVLETAAQRRQGSEPSRALQDRLRAGIGAGRLLSQSSAMEKLYRIISKVAFTRHPVIISGESGTGKEIVARTIHANGPNAISPFVPVSCDALLPGRLEEELFGLNAADGAGRKKVGLLASGGDGTVYLDEIWALEPATQARLARALEERRVRPLGSTETVPLRVRVLASSTRDLQKLVDEGRFRKDLFYRLNVINLRVPPLRERTGDILLLAEHFLDHQRQQHRIEFAFSDEALETMLTYPWAGNIGELEAMIERACSLATGPTLDFEDLSTQVRAFVHASRLPEPTAVALPGNAGALAILTLQEMERKAIVDALQQMGGDKIITAKVLGIGKTTLYRKLKEYGINDDAL